MTIAQCRRCRAEISEEAATCPLCGCGSPVTNEPANPFASPKEQTVVESERSKAGVVPGFATVILMMLMAKPLHTLWGMGYELTIGRLFFGTGVTGPQFSTPGANLFALVATGGTLGLVVWLYSSLRR